MPMTSFDTSLAGRCRVARRWALPLARLERAHERSGGGVAPRIMIECAGRLLDDDTPDEWLRDARGGQGGRGLLFACPPWSGVIFLSPTANGDDTWACGALSAAAVRLRTPVQFLPSDDTRSPFVWNAYFSGGYGLSPSVVVRLECGKDSVSYY